MHLIINHVTSLNFNFGKLIFTEAIFTIFVQEVANIIYLGSNCTHWTGPGWSQFNTATLQPVSVFQQWILPSVEPVKLKQSKLILKSIKIWINIEN